MQLPDGVVDPTPEHNCPDGRYCEAPLFFWTHVGAVCLGKLRELGITSEYQAWELTKPLIEEHKYRKWEGLGLS